MLRNPQQEMISELEERLRRLKAHYDLFFAGIRPLPPTEDHKRFERTIREMSKGRMRDNAARFRFNNVVNKYTLYHEMWNRQMREREEGPLDYRRREAAMRLAGKTVRHKAAAEMPPAPVTTESVNSYVRVTSSGDDAEILALHARISAARKSVGASELSLAQVSAMIDRQLDTIRSRYGAEAVDIRVEVVDGKVKLKAKPIQG